MPARSLPCSIRTTNSRLGAGSAPTVNSTPSERDAGQVVGRGIPSLVAVRHRMVSDLGILDAYLAGHQRWPWAQPNHISTLITAFRCVSGLWWKASQAHRGRAGQHPGQTYLATEAKAKEPRRRGDRRSAKPQPKAGRVDRGIREMRRRRARTMSVFPSRRGPPVPDTYETGTSQAPPLARSSHS